MVLDENLSFNEHISYVKQKSLENPGYVRKLGKPFVQTMVPSLLEYCDAAWHDCGQENCKALEGLQVRAGKIVHSQSKELQSDTITTKLECMGTIAQETGNSY